MDYASLLCCLVAFLLYYNTLNAGFVYDDRRAILSNADLLPTTPWHRLLQDDFWGTPITDSGSHGSYRPFCVLTFRLNYLLGGFQPWGYHLVNVLLHCLATVLLVRVARHVLPRYRRVRTHSPIISTNTVGPAITGLLFAAHPIHTEAVAGVVGRADLAACNLYLLSFLAYIAHVRYRDTSCCRRRQRQQIARNASSEQQQYRSAAKYHRFVVSLQSVSVSNCNWPRRLGVVHNTEAVDQRSKRKGRGLRGAVAEVVTCCWRRSFTVWGALLVAVLLAVASMLSKETGITVLAICALFDFLQYRSISKTQLRSIGILAGTGLVLLLLRLQGPTPQFSTADNPTAKEQHLTTRFLTFLHLPVLNFFLLLCPTTLSFDWGMDAVPRITSIKDPRNFYSLIFYGALTLVVRHCAKILLPTYISTVDDPSEQKFTTSGKLGFSESGVLDVEDRAGGRMMCTACPVCRQGVMMEQQHHTATCRAASNNNNNSTGAGSATCGCVKWFPVQQQPQRRWTSGGNTSTRASSAVTEQYGVGGEASVTPLVLALAFLTLPFLPATNVLFYVGFVVAERVLYLPSAGLCLLMGLGAGHLWRVGGRRYKVPMVAVVACLLIVFSVKTVVRNRDWSDEESLYRSAVNINPAKAYGNLGSVLSSQGRISEAEWAFQQALRHRPNMADVHYNLGVLLQAKQQLNEAVLSFQRAIHFRPSLALAYVNLGSALIKAGRCQEAVSVLRQGARLDGTGLRDRREHDTARVSALLQLGALYSDQGRLQRALATYREAAHSLPKHYPPQSVFNVLGETLARLQQDEEAERWYQAALNAQPDHVPAHITYGKLLARNISRTAEAEQWFRRAQKLAPQDATVYHHYGEFLASRARHREAAVLYEKAAELRPREYELTVATATAMRQAGRHQDAERWYRQAVILKPLDARGHTNLGAILHLNGKYHEAADSYREALRLQPNDVTTLTNLHRLHSVMT